MSELRLNTDGHIIKLGADNDVSLTHVHNTGLLLNSTMQLQFNDASQNINAPSATVLDINATDEIELNATLVDINANVEISGTATTTGVHTFSAAPVFPDGSIAVADLDIDGATDIGAAIVDADLFIIDDGAGGTNRKVTASRLKTYASGLTGVSTGSGNVTITDGNLIVASGHGIDFSATGDTGASGASMDTELLDDYEEGEWTATVVVDGGATAFDAASNTGTYVKIGSLVTLMGFFTVNTDNSSAGFFAIGGIPFASTAYTEGGDYSSGTCFIRNASSAVAGGVVAWVEGSGQSSVALRENGTTGVGNTITNHVDTGTDFTLTIQYRAD